MNHIRKIALIFSCTTIAHMAAMDTKKQSVKVLPLWSAPSLRYDQLTADNARHLKYLVEKERAKGCCNELNKAILVLYENKEKTHQKNYLASHCDPDSMRLIIHLTQRPHHCNQFNDALKKGSFSCVKVMCNINPYIVNAYSLYPDYGCVASPLHYLLWHCGKNVRQWQDGKKTIAYLLEQGANPNGIDVEGNTPLHKACTQEYAELLLAKGAYINAKNNDGLTPVMEHACKERHSLAHFLVKKGADILLQDMDDNTIFHHAVKSEMVDVIECVLYARLGGLSVVNKFQETPAQLIRRSNNRVKKVVQNCMITYMKAALDLNRHDVIRYIVQQCPWVDYTSLFESAQQVASSEQSKKTTTSKHCLIV